MGRDGPTGFDQSAPSQDTPFSIDQLCPPFLDSSPGATESASIQSCTLRNQSNVTLRGPEFVSRTHPGVKGLGSDLPYPAAMGGYAALVFAANCFRACARS